jgi:hypothetical protein
LFYDVMANNALHPQPPLRWVVAWRFGFEFGFWHISVLSQRRRGELGRCDEQSTAPT